MKKHIICVFAMIGSFLLFVSGCSSNQGSDSTPAPVSVRNATGWHIYSKSASEISVKKPAGLAVNGKDVFICDSDSNDIVQLSPDLTFENSWGSLGNEPGNFIQPTDILINENKIYVLDAGNNRVQIFLHPDKVENTIPLFDYVPQNGDTYTHLAVTHTAVYATQSNFSVGGKNFSAFVYGISENFGEYIPFHTITGSLSDIFDSVSPKAIVEVGFLSAKGLSGFSLPFTITIDGVEVEVVGTVKCPLYAQTIFVSTQTLRQFYNSSDAQLQKLLLKSPNTSSGLLQGNLKQLGIDATVTKATQVNESIRASSITNTSIVLLLGFLSLVFSFIDIVEIVVGKLICNKKAIAIKLAIGASKKDIFYEVFLENILLGTVSTLVALFVAFLLLCALPLFTNVLLDFFVAAISWLVCLIVFLLITVVACMVVTRSNIVGMLHRE